MISILITCYNQFTSVTQIVDKILKYTENDDYEIIISDDYSQDDSYNKLLSFYENENNIKIIQPDFKKGVSKNRNTLLKAATKKYCLFIDGDDVQEKHYINKILNVIDDDDIYYIKSFTEVWSENDLVVKESSRYDNVFLYVYKTLKVKDKYFDEDLIIGEDVEFGIRYDNYIQSGKQIIDVSYYLNRREDNISLTKNGDIKRRYDLDLILLRKIYKSKDENILLNAKINQKVIDLINLGVMIDESCEFQKAEIKNVSNKHKVSYISYVIFKKIGLLKVYKILVKRILSSKI